MTYASSTIGAVIDDVNRRYFLPAIQRPYVWSSDQVVALFDSLLKGYPISSFMFWAIDEQTKREVRSYRFLENYRPDAHNEPVSLEGRDAVLVLDGQQRMTSLLIGLRGTFAEKKPRLRKSNPDAWAARTLHLNLLKDPEDIEDDDELGVTYGLSFREHTPRNNHRQYWFKVGSILAHREEGALDGLIQRMRRELHHGVSPYEAELAERNLRRLHDVVWRDDVINFYTEMDQSVDRVLDIFVRANDGGVKLSKADLLMSMITSKWSNGRAREDILGFVDDINTRLHAPNRITKDWVLKAALVTGEFDVVYNVANFTSDAIRQIESNWLGIKQAIEKAFRFVNRMGLSADNLGSLNAVLPIVYYMYRQPDFTFRGTAEFEQINAEAMQRWLLNSLFVGTFVGHSDQTIALARQVIRDTLKTSRNFPIEELFAAMARGGRLSRLDAQAIDELLEMDYKGKRTFVALSLLYPDLDWSEAHHVDHIIPQADAARSILRGRNLSEHHIEEIIAASNRIGNLQLLPAGENIEKSALPFRSWITGRNSDYRQRHLIPDGPHLWDVTALPEFVRAREKLLRERLLTTAGVRQ